MQNEYQSAHSMHEDHHHQSSLKHECESPSIQVLPMQIAQILGPAHLSVRAANQDLFGRRFSLVDWTVVLVGFVVGIFMVIVGFNKCKVYLV